MYRSSERCEQYPPELFQEIVASESFNRPALVLAHMEHAAKAARSHFSSSATEESSALFDLSLVDATSNRPLEELISLPFPELHLGVLHHGFVVTGTLCVPAFQTAAVITLLEDEDGRAVKLAIYNAVPPGACSPEEIQELFPQGAKVAIREPYFKRYADGTVGLRVNNPGDLVFLTEETEDYFSALFLEEADYTELRIKGNSLFANGDWFGAVRLYSKSISAAEKELEKLKQIDSQRFASSGSQQENSSTTGLSRTGTKQENDGQSSSSGLSSGIINICLQMFSKNICSSSEIVQPSNGLVQQQQVATSSRAQVNYEKKTIKLGLISAYSNRAEALLRMRKNREALSDARAALAIDPIHVKSVYRKGRALHAIGCYKEAVECFKQAVELAPNDYEVQRALDEGITSEKQSNGEFDFTKFYESEFSDTIPSCVDYVGPVRVGYSGFEGAGRGLFVTKDVSVGELLLVSNALGIVRVNCNPSSDATNDATLEELVRQLYTRVKTSEDKYRIIRQLNCLFTGIQRRKLPPDDLVHNEGLANITMEETVSMDLPKIRRIVQWNGFDESGFATHGSRTKTSGCLGLWFLPSFINHSCLPNVSRVHIGDAMLVRATRDIKAGEEVFHPYTDIIRPIRHRREAVHSGWGFVCSCPRCMLEENMEDSLKAATELYDVLAGHESGGTTINYNTYLERALYSLSDYLCAAIEECNNIEAAISGLSEMEQKWIRASFTLVFLMAASAFELENRPKLVNAMREAVVCAHPGDPQTLKLVAMVAEETKLLQGVNSEAHRSAEAIAVGACNAIFGKQKHQHVTKALIDACLKGLLDS